MYVQTPITVFNRRLGADRREIYFPTCICSASFLESQGTARSADGARSQALTYKLRIPYNAQVQNNRAYVQRAEYRLLDNDAASGFWTIQTGDYILPLETALSVPVSYTEIETLAANNRLVAVKEFADNTVRGSAAVKHWRIGGE